MFVGEWRHIDESSASRCHRPCNGRPSGSLSSVDYSDGHGLPFCGGRFTLGRKRHSLVTLGCVVQWSSQCLTAILCVCWSIISILYSDNVPLMPLSLRPTSSLSVDDFSVAYATDSRLHALVQMMYEFIK